MENEVALISAVSKGQGFIYRTRAIQLEEKGPFSSVISVKGVEAWIRWPPVMMRRQETNMGIYKDQSFLGGLQKGKVNQTLVLDLGISFYLQE